MLLQPRKFMYLEEGHQHAQIISLGLYLLVHHNNLHMKLPKLCLDKILQMDGYLAYRYSAFLPESLQAKAAEEIQVITHAP